MAKEHMIITIGRQFGSGGTEIGKRLARDLNIAFYDKEILRLAAKRSGIQESFFHLSDERPGTKLLYRIIDKLSPKLSEPETIGDVLSGDNLFKFQSAVIRQLADEEDFVIMGRLADYILRDRKNIYNFFIHADEQYRIRHMVEVHNYDEGEAMKLVRQRDREREEYNRYYSGRKYQNAEDYLLCADSGRIPEEQIVEMIKGVIHS